MRPSVTPTPCRPPTTPTARVAGVLEHSPNPYSLQTHFWCDNHPSKQRT